MWTNQAISHHPTSTHFIPRRSNCTTGSPTTKHQQRQFTTQAQRNLIYFLSSSRSHLSTIVRLVTTLRHLSFKQQRQHRREVKWFLIIIIHSYRTHLKRQQRRHQLPMSMAASSRLTMRTSRISSTWWKQQQQQHPHRQRWQRQRAATASHRWRTKSFRWRINGKISLRHRQSSAWWCRRRWTSFK